MWDLSKTWELLKTSALEARAVLDAGASREVALEKGGALVISTLGRLTGEAETLSRATLTLSEVIPTVGLGWLECGFPCVEVGAKLAASLMCTGMSRDLVPDVRMPWASFSIRIPAELLGTSFGETVLHIHESGILRVSKTPGGFGLSRKGSLADFADIATEPESKVGRSAASWPLSSDDWLRERLFGRLIVGVCIEMTKHRPTPDNEAFGKRPPSRARGLPTSWTFRLTRPVELDARPAIKDWLGGKRGGKLTLQSMVHGHHKMQPCGAGRPERKWIHIEPYWRGDPDAPIAQRPHKLGE